MSLNRREMLRLGAVGAGAAIASSAAATMGLPLPVYNRPLNTVQPLAPRVPPMASVPYAPHGVDAHLFARARAALNSHRIGPRDFIGIADFSRPSSERRFHVVDMRNGHVESFRVAHGSGSDPNHNGFLDRFSNDFGSYATSNGTYTTGEYYHGKYGLSMKTHGHDWSNSNAEPRAIVIHNAWYAEPNVLAQTGKLGRSQGCFAFSRADQRPVMEKLAGGRMIYADKLA
jgi:hypothetical protein